MATDDVISSCMVSNNRRRCCSALRSDVTRSTSTGSRTRVDKMTEVRPSQRCTKRFELPVCTGNRYNEPFDNTPVSTSGFVFLSPFHISPRAFSIVLIFSFLMTSSPPFLMTSSMISAQSFTNWVAWPTDKSELIGQNASFDCIIARNVTASDQFLWTRISDDGTVTNLFLNTESWTPGASRLRAYYVTGGMQLVLSDIDQTDDAKYQCQVSTMATQKQGRLTVVVNPGQPIVTLVAPASQSNLFENNVTQLSCSSSGGNPAPNVTWYRNGQLMSSVGVTWFPPSVKFGVTTSVLSRTLTSNDNLANFSCLASSDVIRPFSISSLPLQLSVKYAPIVSVGPHPRISVVEGSVLTITCNVDANPAVSPSSLQWFINGTSLNVFGSTYTLNKVQAKQDGGLYTCVATNFVTRNNSVFVDVLYAPRLVNPVSNLGGVILSGQFQVSEGSPINVSFSVDSNPAVSENSFQWYKDGTPVAAGRYLALSVTSRKDAGVYVCNVTNTMTPTGSTLATTGYGTGLLTLIVFYKPGNAMIVGPQLAVTGDDVTMTCLLDDPGNPQATVTWIRSSDATQFPPGSALHLGIVGLSSIGVYSCQGDNVVGTGRAANISFDVAEPPSWSLPLLSNQLVTMVNITSSVLTANCSAYGRPQPAIQWTKDGQPLDSDFYQVLTSGLSYNGYRTNVTSSIFWRGLSRAPNSLSLRPEDNGQYTCTLVSNLSMVSTSQTVGVYVKYPPIMSTQLVKVALDSGQAAQLICRCQAFPVPTFSWTTLATPVGSQMASWMEPFDPYPFVAALNISLVRTSDLGTYFCDASNSMGSSRTLFNVTVKTSPDNPRNLTVISKGWESVAVSWLPSFDGGYRQTFYVTVSALPSGLLLVYSAGNQSVYNATGLFPSTWYSVSVAATNRIGNSPPSNTINFQTNDLQLSSPTSVQYNVNTRTLTFQNTNTNQLAVCLTMRVIVTSSSSWQALSPACPAPANGAVVLADPVMQQAGVQAVEVTFCVQGRPDVCSAPLNATITANDDVPVVTIIVVVCVCGGVILILAIALTAICYRRRLARRKNGLSSAANPASVISSPNGPYLQQGDNKPGSHHLPMRLVIGYDNPIADQTNLSNKVYFDGLDYYSHDDIASESAVRQSPPPYDRHQRQSPPFGSNGSDSGVPDTPKPTRRIIYEVVV